MKVRTGCSIKDLFCGQFGLKDDYFEERIQTIFMDGNPVDDAASAIVRDGSHIAVSGAMPGLVGAVLRKGGFYSSLRSGISYRGKNKTGFTEEGTVSLKIFNLLLREIGPAFLEKGIQVKGIEVQDFLKKRPDDFWRGFASAKVNGKDTRQEELLNMKWPYGPVFLQVRPWR